MRYISNDNRIFNTEQECCEYEQKVENEKIKNEKLKIEYQNRLNAINKKYKELQDLIYKFEKDYNVKVKLNEYSMPFAELVYMLI